MDGSVEVKRLAALDRLEILDTAPEPLFDSLTELAAKTFEVPIALISLVDANRQWFKACVGLDVDQTARNISFCQYTILGDDVFMVPDALADERFSENPLVTEAPFIRFYAGAPLITPEGHHLGALCIIDTVPRATFDDVAATKLKAMAASVMQAMQMRIAARESAALEAVAFERQAMLLQAEKAAGIGTWTLDVASGQTAWSDEVYRIHGFDPSTASPKLEDALACYLPDDAKTMAAHVHLATTTGLGFEQSARIVRPDGEERHVIARGDCRRAASGEISALFGTFHDVTALKLADEALRAREGRSRHLLDHATDVILRFNESAVLEVSPSCRIFGYEPSDLVGISVMTLIHADDILTLMSAMQDNFNGREPDRNLSREYRLRTKDGTYRWVEGNPTVIRDQDGTVVEVISVIRDVTDRKAAELALADKEAHYRLLTENSRDIIARYDAVGRFTYLSPAVSTVLGYTAEELLGKTPACVMHPDDLPQSTKLLVALSRQGAGAPPMKMEYRAYCKNGELIWLEANPRAMFDGNGNLIEFQDSVRDVSRRKALETELAAARDAAIVAAKVKAEFMANISHEIRTPLTAIIGFTSLLSARTDLAEAAATQVQRVRGAGTALLSIVNDILDFSKLEASQVAIRPRPVAVAELAQDVMAMFGPEAEAKSLWLELEQEPTVPTTVSVDPDRLRQVLLNLIGNAIKFTDEGFVRLRLSYDQDLQRLRFAVEDTGPGMDASQTEKLFVRFSQVDASSTRRHGGTGLGLAISKALTEAMGGDIGVTSRPGLGSTFNFSVSAPVAEAAAPRDGATALAVLDGVRVLVADDNASNREIACLLLEDAGAEVTQACDGEQAVEHAEQTPFDVILLDLHMPILGGAEALLLIRAGGGPNRDVPIIAFTAEVGVDGRAPAGFDGVVPKPIAAENLISTLAHATSWVDAAAQEAYSHVAHA